MDKLSTEFLLNLYVDIVKRSLDVLQWNSQTYTVR